MTSSVVSAEQQCESIMVEKTAEAVGVVQSCADDLSTMQNRSAGYEMEGGGRWMSGDITEVSNTDPSAGAVNLEGTNLPSWNNIVSINIVEDLRHAS